MWQLCRKGVPKTALQKCALAKRKWVTIPGSGGPWDSSLACTLFIQETIVRAAVAALFEILAEKWTGFELFAKKHVRYCDLFGHIWRNRLLIYNITDTIYCSKSISSWSDTPWARPAEFGPPEQSWEKHRQIACLDDPISIGGVLDQDSAKHPPTKSLDLILAGW